MGEADIPELTPIPATLCFVKAGPPDSEPLQHQRHSRARANALALLLFQGDTYTMNDDQPDTREQNEPQPEGGPANTSTPGDGTPRRLSLRLLPSDHPIYRSGLTFIQGVGGRCNARQATETGTVEPSPSDAVDEAGKPVDGPPA